MKRTLLPLAAVAVVLAMLFSGCVGAAPEQAIPEEPEGRFAQPNPMWGVAIKSDGTPYEFAHLGPFGGFGFMDVIYGVNDTLIERAGGKPETTHAGGNVENQLAAFEDAMVRKPDAIVFSAVDSPAISPFIEMAVDAGLPVFDYDHVTGHPLITGSVTDDQVVMGELAGEWFVEYAERTGQHLNILELWGSKEQDGAIKRHQGYHNSMENHPLITLYEGPDTRWKNDEAMNAVLDIFPTHPELNAIACPYDMTPGINEALRTIGRLYPVGDPEHVLVTTMAGEPEVLDHIREGLVDGCVAHSPWEIADVMTKIMLNYVCLEQPVPEQYFLIPTFMITADNIDNPRWGAPMLWGDMKRSAENFDLWPILDTAEIGVETPTIK